MKAAEKFLNQPKSFWASVRSISEEVGYTVRGKGTILVPSQKQMQEALNKRGLSSDILVEEDESPSPLAITLEDYFTHRADVLNNYVEPRLMDGDRAKGVFDRLVRELSPSCPVPMNKQRGDKKRPAYFTAIINMIVEANAEGLDVNYDPRQLTTVTLGGVPLRTLARRVDGAFPGAVNPIAVWETKEYYYTTTFGSRVADGVYESLLDGMELEELQEHEGIEVLHYFMVDSHYTWWECGRSYLCRICDMLHMGYLDEALFGYEVVERLPALVTEWVRRARERENLHQILRPNN